MSSPFPPPPPPGSVRMPSVRPPVPMPPAAPYPAELEEESAASHPETMSAPRASTKALAASMTPKGFVQAPRARKTKWGLFLAIPLLLTLGLGGAYFYYLSQRQTSIVCELRLEGYDIKGDAYLTHGFNEEIEAIQQKFEEAKLPLQQKAEEREKLLVVLRENVKSTAAKAAALAREEIELRESLKIRLSNRDQSARAEWDQAVAALRAEQAQRKAEFRNIIATRAKQIKIQWPESFAIDEPDLVVSAFRLGLYNASKDVKGKEELLWAEAQLNNWREYLKQVETRLNELKEKARVASQQVDPQAVADQTKLEELSKTSLAASQEAENAAAELKTTESSLEQVGFGTMALAQTFMEELQQLPEKHIIMTGGRDKKGRLFFEHLEKNPEVPPGEYQIFYRAQKGEDAYWGFIPVVTIEMQETEVVAVPEQLVKVSSLLDQPGATPTAPSE